MKLLAAITLCLFVTSASVCAAAAEGEALPRGEVLEGVILRSDSSQSYALYLPSAYAPERKWPVLVCFDPLARGRVPVERFRKAAEAHGFVVLGSNNSRNGIDGALVSKYVAALWADAHERLNIDDSRVYAAGFSGGARLAIGFAANCRGCVAGVFAGGAGLPTSLKPTAPLPFAVFGAVGFDDFNFVEMRELQKRLDEAGTPSVFETFEGGHEWPPEAVCEKALAWFRLRAMLAGALEREEKFLDARLASRLADAGRRFEKGQHLDAYESYLAVVRDFQGRRDVRAAVENVERLKNSREVKSEIRSESEMARRQAQETAEIRSLWTGRPDDDEHPSPRHDARGRLADWRRKGTLAEDSAERRVARRVLSGLLIGAYEEANGAVARRKDYGAAASALELARGVEPKDASLAYELARLYALGGRKRRALETLEEAIELGFKDGGRLASDAAFASVSREPRFTKMTSTLK